MAEARGLADSLRSRHRRRVVTCPPPRRRAATRSPRPPPSSPRRRHRRRGRCQPVALPGERSTRSSAASRTPELSRAGPTTPTRAAPTSSRPRTASTRPRPDSWPTPTTRAPRWSRHRRPTSSTRPIAGADLLLDVLRGRPATEPTSRRCATFTDESARRSCRPLARTPRRRPGRAGPRRRRAAADRPAGRALLRRLQHAAAAVADAGADGPRPPRSAGPWTGATRELTTTTRAGRSAPAAAATRRPRRRRPAPAAGDRRRRRPSPPTATARFRIDTSGLPTGPRQQAT